MRHDEETKLRCGHQQLDSKTLQRLETAVAKSAYVGQGKKLKTTNKVSHTFNHDLNRHAYV